MEKKYRSILGKTYAYVECSAAEKLLARKQSHKSIRKALIRKEEQRRAVCKQAQQRLRAIPLRPKGVIGEHTV